MERRGSQNHLMYESILYLFLHWKLIVLVLTNWREESMKIIKVIQALLPVISKLIRDLADDGKLDKTERDELLVAAGLAIAGIIGDVLEK